MGDISIGAISHILHDIAVEARVQIEQKHFLETIPFETRKSLLKMDAMDKIAWDIASNSEDERCRMQALSCLSVQDTRRRDLLLSTEVVDRAISAQKAALLNREIESIQDNIKQREAKIDSITVSDTGDNNQDTRSQEGYGEKAPISVSGDKRKKHRNANNV